MMYSPHVLDLRGDRGGKEKKKPKKDKGDKKGIQPRETVLPNAPRPGSPVRPTTHEPQESDNR